MPHNFSFVDPLNKNSSFSSFSKCILNKWNLYEFDESSRPYFQFYINLVELLAMIHVILYPSLFSVFKCLLLLVPYVCLFVWGFSSHSRIFHSYGDVTITGKGLQFWPMLGTYGHWAMRVLYRATPTVTRGIRL